MDLSDFRQEIAAAKPVVAQCAASARACDGRRVPANGQVKAEEGHPAFAADWDWLATLLDAAKGAKPADRSHAMQLAGAHLQAWLAETQQLPVSAGQEREARRAQDVAASVLARPEFADAEQPPSWWDRLLARVQDWFFQLLEGLSRAGSQHPWLAPAIEWSCFAVASGGLLFFIRRSLARQSLRIALGGELVRAHRADRDAVSWAQMAKARAAAGDWREGVHCLYWAAITSLEDRRAWRLNPTRTPREYLRLLRPETEAYRALRELTRALERVWYGYGEATETVFLKAQRAYEALLKADFDKRLEATRGDAQAGRDRGSATDVARTAGAA